ncbi:S8 family peptidase [Paenibacillus sp. NEAU-GSW1]|uniref:S8 family peptidase n=1 Tax=Paenibacillus sp. NEAU-GSW1 TaxID=2682486 RepID=UPI0012E17D30|nr:S8 family peptidase [Paenibacillus sp. NEAU-GSW1]MUT66693.1 S8 family serine peptidase [Paenibacillus sp. NEAU-GSW1]
MKKKWIGVFSVLAAATLLIPAAPMFIPDKTPAAPKSSALSVKQQTVKYEHAQKLKVLNNDMEATALLCVSECSKEFYKLMSHSPSAKPEKIKHLMDMHKHMSYISWLNGNRAVERGSIPASAGNEADKYVAEARVQVKQGNRYVSKAFTADNGSRFVVLGVPDPNHKGIAVVSVIKQDIVEQVERHQQRNLRLVPYPSEGNYRIESVKPNSTKETTVETGEDNSNASHYHVRDVVVHFVNQPSDKQLNQIKAKVNAAAIQRIGDTYVFRSKDMDADKMIHYFKNAWQTEYVEPHYLYMTNETKPNDALYSQYQWNLPSIKTELGWDTSKGNDQVIVAVLDTGVQTDHPDLKGKLIKGNNIVDSDAAPSDDVGHGTHVAGIIGATVNNGEGVAGLSWYNKIMPVKVLDSSGAGSAYSVAQGIIWATDHGAKVINMSLGNYAQAEFLHDAIKYAYDHDVVLVAASGNDNTERPGYPAAYPEVFAVAATDAQKQKASFSNYGNYIDVAAPGDSIASTYPGGQYAALSGTSMASPHVAALAGLIRSVNPDLTNKEVMEIMRKSADDLGDKGKDNYFGYGLIDVDSALKAAANYNTALQNYPSQVKKRLNAIAQTHNQ